MNTLIIYIVLRSGDSEIACLQNTMNGEHITMVNGEHINRATFIIGDRDP